MEFGSKYKSENKNTLINLNPMNHSDSKKQLPKHKKIKQKHNLNKRSLFRSPAHYGIITDYDVISKSNKPPNVNPYRQIIDHANNDSDIGWITQLRTYKTKPLLRLRQDSMSPPTFYNKDLINYSEKVKKAKNEDKKNPLSFHRNLGEYDHLLTKPGLSSNYIQFAFDSTLRTSNSKNIIEEIWKPSCSSQSNKDSVSSPIINANKEYLSKIEKYVPRPLEQVVDIYYLKNEKVRRRKFVPSNSSTLVSVGEHFASLYTNKFKEKNLNSIRHIIAEPTNSMGLWGSGLRNYKLSKKTE